MASSGLYLVKSSPRERRERLSRRDAIEQALRQEHQAASDELDYIIAMHLPGRVQGAYDRYIEATLRLENFLKSGDIPEHLQRLARAS